MSWLHEHADLECCDIVTTGRRTGKPHEIEIWFGVMDGAMYLISGNGPTADWYLNMLANPEVIVKLGGEQHLGRARRGDRHGGAPPMRRPDGSQVRLGR